MLPQKKGIISAIYQFLIEPNCKSICKTTYNECRYPGAESKFTTIIQSPMPKLNTLLAFI